MGPITSPTEAKDHDPEDPGRPSCTSSEKCLSKRSQAFSLRKQVWKSQQTSVSPSGGTGSPRRNQLTEQTGAPQVLRPWAPGYISSKLRSGLAMMEMEFDWNELSSRLTLIAGC